MPAPPLTHHEILGLVEPFARHGRHVDLAASDRGARKLRFRPAEVAGLHEVLELDCQGAPHFRLTRTLTHPGGAQATLQTAGREPAALLAQIEAVDAKHQFVTVQGHVIARSYEVDATAGSPPLRLTGGSVQFDGLTFKLGVMAVRGVAADVSLVPAPTETLDLPEDLLAVQGWDWARLVPYQDGWTSKLRLHGKAGRRTRGAEQALEQVTAHLHRVLAETPAQFHRRHAWARWGVVVRRSIPTLTAVFLIGGALLLPRVTDEQNAGLWMALHYVPIGLLALSFSLQELARFEIPRPPRALRGRTWRRGAAGDAPVQHAAAAAAPVAPNPATQFEPR